MSIDGYGLAFVVDVFADDGGAYSDCGAPGYKVSFKVGNKFLLTTAFWDNSQVWELALNAWCRNFLPFIFR